MQRRTEGAEQMDHVFVTGGWKTTERFLSLTVKRPLTGRRTVAKSRKTNFHLASTGVVALLMHEPTDSLRR